jgi:pimeloyl-ACP methyl ester carboxylesterase
MPHALHPRRRAPGWLALARAQMRVPLGIAAAYDGPRSGRLARLLAGKVREEEAWLAGVPAVVFRPGRGSGQWPTVVLFPGVTRQGRRHPAFLGIGRGLAAAGRLAIVAEPEGLAVGELTPTAVSQARATVEAALSRPDAAPGGVSLVGVSGGGTLALRTAADPSMAERVSVVLTLAPLCDVSEAIRVVTTGVYRDGDALVPFSAGDFFKLVIARSVVACLTPGDDRSALRSRLLALDDYGADPLSSLKDWPAGRLGAAARATVALLSNEDPDRFDDLLDAVPEELRAAIDAISPLSVAHRIAAPVELVVAREDKYITLADATSFAEACATVRLTVLAALEHAVPELSPAAVRDLARLDGVLVRLLAAAYSRR